jgi:hypothetical protein
MDIIKLDPTTYLPTRAVEGLSSKIWAERFLRLGDFVLKSRDIAGTRAALPKGSFISHTDTKEVMMVEDLVETTDDQGIKELTVTGRSADLILENRWVEGVYQKRRTMVMNYGPAHAALVLMWQAVDNATGFDVTRPRKGEDNDGERWPWNTLDAIPNVMITETTTGFATEIPTRKWLKEGLLYEQLIKILEADDYGIRTIRPGENDYTDVNRISVRSAENLLGEIVETPLASTTALRFDLYRGQDRSHLQDWRPRLTFNVDQRELTQPNYVDSIKEWKTGVEIMSGQVTLSDVYRAGESGNSGWNRRIMGFDAGTPEVPDPPDDPGKNATPEQNNNYETKLAAWRNKRDAIYEDFREDARADAVRELKKFREVYLFSGNVSPSNPYIYKKDYGLGDTISIKDEYNNLQRMVILEYIRTDDAEGDRGYPGLALA